LLFEKKFSRWHSGKNFPNSHKNRKEIVMRIAVMGIGGIGGYYGGKLALAYAGSGKHEIIFIARGEHLAAIRKNGLRLITPEGEYQAVPTLATDHPKEAGLLDLVLFCVKSYSLEEAARVIAGSVRRGSVILPLLNGVDITERLKTLLPGCAVLNGCVYIGASIEGPGVVQHKGGTGQLIFGPDPKEDVEKYRDIEALLKGAGIPAELVKDAVLPLWTKYIFIDPLASLTARLGKSFGAILENEGEREMLADLMKEVESIARVKGVNFPDDIVRVTLQKAAGFPYATKTSFQLDYEKGRQTEMDIFASYIIKAGKELGIATPLHERVYGELLKKQ
jgi:2-dehydropantoate 2-reductase